MNPDTTGTRLQVFASPWRHALLLAAGVAMTATCLFVLRIGGVRGWLVGGLGVAFFGPCTLAIAWLFVRSVWRRTPEVVLDPAGIFVRRWRLGTIPWHDIAAVRVWHYRRQRCLCVDLVDRDRYLQRLPRWQRWLAAANERLGAGTLAISFVGLTPGLDEALQHLDRWRAGDGSSHGAEPGA